MREQDSLSGFAGQGNDRTLAQYRASIAKVATLHNFFYADRKGNIAYFGAGRLPILPRCGACDPRLPHNGDGSQEWQGFVAFRDMPQSINPAQGYLVNWNTKPDTQHYYQQNSGDEYWGTIYRSDRIARLIRSHGRNMTFANMLAVERDIGTIDDNSYRPTATYFLPYLFRAYARLKAGHDPLVDQVAHPSLAAAIATLKRWDDNRTHGQPAMSIYVQFVAALTRNLFSGGVNVGEHYTGVVNLADKSVDGTDYSGWQTQPGRRTVQETLEAALAALTGADRVRANASGRTDAGVHAVGQVVNFRGETALAADVLLRALNAHLPEDVVVREAREVPPEFDANRDAKRKLYRYVIHDGAVPDLFMRRYCHHSRYKLDAAAMARAAAAKR